MEGAASRGRAAPGARRRHGRLDARAEHDVDADPGQLRNVPEADRPKQEALEVDYDPWEGIEWPPSVAVGISFPSPQEGGDSPS